MSNLWDSSSENALVLVLANISMFVICFKSVFNFFLNTSLTMKLVYEFLQKRKKNSYKIRMVLLINNSRLP